MTDLHCHILPGFDDGAQTRQELLDMAAMAARCGTRRIVCTPHCTAGDPELAGRAEAIRETVQLANGWLQAAGIAVTLYPGMELLATDALAQTLESSACLTLGGSRYLLVEFDFSVRSAFITQSLETVRRAGLYPVLAHPERYVCVQRRPELAAQWFHLCLLQLNKGSLTGGFGPGPEATAGWIVDNGLAHLAASDAHGVRLRTPDLRAAYDRVARRTAPDYARVLFCRNPELVLAGRPVLRPEELELEFGRKL